MLELFALDSMTTFYSIWEHVGLHNKNGYATSVIIFENGQREELLLWNFGHIYKKEKETPKNNKYHP